MMLNGFSNKPRILRGAFVEYVAGPRRQGEKRLIVPFQFNPERLSRSRRLYFSAPNEARSAYLRSGAGYLKLQREAARWRSLREFYQHRKELSEIQRERVVSISDDPIDIEIRLDATDKLNEGDPIAERFGISPELARLEMMIQPKEETVPPRGFSKGKSPKLPMILFVWGRNWVLPVNINSMSIAEMEFSPDLNPTRATIGVNMTVIGGANEYYNQYIQKIRSDAAMADQDVTNVVIPGER